MPWQGSGTEVRTLATRIAERGYHVACVGQFNKRNCHEYTRMGRNASPGDSESVEDSRHPAEPPVAQRADHELSATLQCELLDRRRFIAGGGCGWRSSIEARVAQGVLDQFGLRNHRLASPS